MAAPLSEKLKRISALKRKDGCRILCEELGWEPFDEEDDPQKSIHLDCLYDNLMFMINKGFQWNEISVLFQVVSDTVQECIGVSLHEAVRLYSVKLQSVAAHCNEVTLNKFTQFFFTTFMRHFKLYKYVFSQSQDRLQTNIEASVNTPQDPVPFTHAKDVDVYQYEKKYEELEEEELKREQTHEEKLNSLNKETAEKINKSLEPLEHVEPPLTREAMIQLIHEVASAQISATSDVIKCQLTNTMEDLDIKLEKTALPRPQTLGAPPRYKSKTPVPTSPSKRQITSREALQSNSKSRQSSRTGKK